MALHLNRLVSPTPKDVLSQIWAQIGPVDLEKKIKNVKVYVEDDDKNVKFYVEDDDNNDKMTDNRQISIRKAHLSLRLEFVGVFFVWEFSSQSRIFH